MEAKDTVMGIELERLIACAELRNPKQFNSSRERYLAEISFKAGKKEERDSWLLKTDPEKARDAFTKDIIERSYAQGIREVVEWIKINANIDSIRDEWHIKLKGWGIE